MFFGVTVRQVRVCGTLGFRVSCLGSAARNSDAADWAGFGRKVCITPESDADCLAVSEE